MFEIIRSDLKRYREKDQPSLKMVLYLFFEQGIWAVLIYRFGRWVKACRVPVLAQLLKIVAFLLFKITEMVTGISLPASAKIGKGFYIGHFGSIIFHSNTVVGQNCSVGTGVIIGTRGLGKKGVPHIGDNVYIGVGSKILGNITIGNNVKIGANSVVLKDVPDDVTVAGIPARIIKEKEK